MHLIPFIIDSPLPHTSGEAARDSLLMLPLGTQYVLDSLAPSLQQMGSGHMVVMPGFQHGAEYEERLRASTSWEVRIVGMAELPQWLSSCETSDYLLMIEPRVWPVRGYDLAELAGRSREYRGATHGIGIGVDRQQSGEQVECDTNGLVSRVRRVYSLMSWPEAGAAAFCSIVPAWAIRDVRFSSLAEVHAAVARRGVCTQDVPVATDVRNLADEADFLRLSESMILQAISRPPEAPFVRRSPDVLVGPGCTLHPSATLIGPVILQQNVTIEAEATVVGPTVVGSGARIQRGAVVAQSVLSRDATVTPHGALRHRVLSGRTEDSSAAGSRTDNPPVEAIPSSGEFREQTLADPAIRNGNRRRAIHLTAKRLMDVVLVSLGLIVLSPLMIAVAVLIKLTSPGPVFFIHRREGKNGKEFPCFKFRTMVADAHKQQRQLYQMNQVDGPQFKLDHDPRVTPIGNWLRNTNIDELPQLINVLVGHMSLVGPRPSPFRENQICVPWRRARLSVRSGITGLWQICRSPDRSSGDFHEWIYYDMLYVRNLSVWLDVKILFWTVFTCGGRRSLPLSRLISADRQADAGSGTVAAVA